MGVLKRIFGHDKDDAQPELLYAVDRAVSAVEPLLKNIHGYPAAYREYVARALDYARSLAASVPGPLSIHPRSFALDPLVHTLFPTLDSLVETFCASESMLDYLRQFPASGETYALMGMRRMEKTLFGMELSGDNLRRDVLQQAVYFTSHTLENPAKSEADARELIAWSFFDSLVKDVATLTAERKHAVQSLRLEKDLLTARMQTAKPDERAALEKDFAKLLSDLQAASDALDLRHYREDFETVLSDPERYLRLEKTVMFLDDMGIRHAGTDDSRQVVFNDLIGYDRRSWTVLLVACEQMEFELPAADIAPRRLKR